MPRPAPTAKLLAWLALAGGTACGSDPMAEVLRADPDRPFQVRVFTAASLDGPWALAERPLATGMSSLGLHEEVDGALVLVGLPMVEPSALDELLPMLKVWGLRTAGPLSRAEAADPSRWSPITVTVDDMDAVAAIDPQGYEGGWWYYAAEGRGGDPALNTAPHAIRSSPPGRQRMLGPGLADPSPVRFHGETVLFVTAHPDAVVMATGDDFAEKARFSGVSVPFARLMEADELLLLAQAPIQGRRQPVWSRTRDGAQWSAWQPVLDPGPLRSCTSPVLGRLSDGWMLACVEEPGS